MKLENLIYSRVWVYYIDFVNIYEQKIVILNENKLVLGYEIEVMIEICCEILFREVGKRMVIGILGQYEFKWRRGFEWNVYWDNIQVNESNLCDKMYVFYGIKE